uniref:AMOP domain protein n=1 Tax=Panagrolaimus sp. JU765 TaxID=591449 RepID=A0AC34RJM6_9BILA
MALGHPIHRALPYYSAILLFILPFCFIPEVLSQIQPNYGNYGAGAGLGTGQSGGVDIQANQNAQIYTGTGNNVYYGVNLVPFGPDVGDHRVHPGLLTAGQTVDLHMWFPFYGGFYNYTTISVNGYMSFATVLDQGPAINVGPDATDWPRQQDPAMIAPYLCKQQIPQNGGPSLKSGVYYRLIMRQSMFGRGSNSNINVDTASMQGSSIFGNRFERCPGTPDGYVRCDSQGDYFLDEMMRWLQEGVAGANAFRADAAFIVTWLNTASAVSNRVDFDNGELATYQVIWLTDQPGRLSYVILNYDKLGFDAADVRLNSRLGRCQALFNGGNHTGMVPVDPTFMFKNTPTVLAKQSGVPHMVRGRYMFRVDDIVRPGGCSNKTGGSYPMMIYPNIVNMLGEMTVDVNAMCLVRTQTYKLMIEQRQVASCTVINPSIARCTIPKIYDWGTKTVFFQPESTGANDEKAFVGYIYFVPPTLDPMRLDIGNTYDWFKNPIETSVMPISWYPRNFTNPDLNYQDNIQMRMSDDALYGVQLGLYIIGYKETKDDNIKKFRPEHRVLARMTTYSNRNQYEYRFQPQKERINLNQIEHWYMTDWERMHELYTYRVGYFKLAPIRSSDQNIAPNLISGLVSTPISLHWLWTSNNPRFDTTTYSQQQADARSQYVIEKATEMCHDWYDEDGAQWNFLRDTETNASCPCVESQAKYDIGRFMPHPRCSQMFRDISCTVMIGAKNCYMSASNIYGSYAGTGRYGDSMDTSRFPTHYGQVCCYDEKGYLMQTTYQPVIKVIEQTPYNPGFPLRAYEFGTSPYMGQFEVPGLSAFHHDYMPYFLCCKYAKFRCQLFYWRRPSSGCQQYQPAAVGKAVGAGSFNTIDNDKFVFNEPGVYNLLYIPETPMTPEVRIQVRLERYPNRRVDFGMLGRTLSQEDLVQPSNATVITGVAIEATGTDRVYVMARKDTRRFRYRTSVIVGNILRYFDTMRLQRFRGVLVYVNNVERGQAEIYVVLEEAQIGIYVSESFATDIDRLAMYQESMGFLDVTLSVPPQYGVRPDGDKTREQEIRTRYNLPRVAGLMRPFPDQTTGSFYTTLSINDINSETYRQQIINNYRIPGSGGAGTTDTNVGTLNQNMPTDNMFTTTRDEDKMFDAFPETYLKSEPVYKVAPVYENINHRFYPMTGANLEQLLQNCIGIESNQLILNQPYSASIYEQYASRQCPDNPAEIHTDCGDNVPCLYDYTMLNSKVIGHGSKDMWNLFQKERLEATRQYNSCGPINIEYPEYLIKTPALAPSYMQGDTARFECFQTHWIHGDHEYKCSIIVDHNDYNRYRFEWNKGSQPWCRSREFENVLKWLTAILLTIAIIMILIMIFLCCWCVKRKHLQAKEEESETSFIPAGATYPPGMDSFSVASERRSRNKPDDFSSTLTPDLRNRNRNEKPPVEGNFETESLIGRHTSV